jgi:hypothetical protein
MVTTESMGDAMLVLEMIDCPVRIVLNFEVKLAKVDVIFQERAVTLLEVCSL